MKISRQIINSEFNFVIAAPVNQLKVYSFDKVLCIEIPDINWV